MKRNLFSAALSLSMLTGCSLLKVSGVPGSEGDPEAAKSATPTSSSAPASANETQNASSTTPNKEPEKEVSKCDTEAERLNFMELQNVGAVERSGELTVSDAIAGLSSEPLKERIKSECKKLGGEPSAAVLTGADELAQRQRDAAAAAAKKWGETVKPTVAASKDAAAEKAITEDFLKWHAGADIKKVVLTDASWKQNYDGLVVRNRYKEAEVLIGVKGESFCLSVPANVAQASTGTGFEKAYKHDVFDRGRAVPCN